MIAYFDGSWGWFCLGTVLVPPALLLVVFGMVERARRRCGDDDPAPRCRRCGYLLKGLTQPRCPECGTGFDEEHQGAE